MHAYFVLGLMTFPMVRLVCDFSKSLLSIQAQFFTQFNDQKIRKIIFKQGS